MENNLQISSSCLVTTTSTSTSIKQQQAKQPRPSLQHQQQQYQQQKQHYNFIAWARKNTAHALHAVHQVRLASHKSETGVCENAMSNWTKD